MFLFGTFGSGKTTVVNSLIENLVGNGAKEEEIHRVVPRLDNKEKFFGHRYTDATGLRKPVILIGRYGKNACAGADMLSWKGSHEDIEQFINENIESAHMIMEGSITSSTTRYFRVSNELKHKNIRNLFLFLTTDRETCVERVKSRRLQKFNEKVAKSPDKEHGEPKEFDRTNLDKLYDTVEKQAVKCKNLGLNVKFIESEPHVGGYVFGLLMADERVSV